MALLFRLVLAHLLVDLVAHWAQSLLLTSVAYLPGLGVTVLLLLGHGEFVGELLTESGVYRLASFFPHLSWSVIALLLWHLLALDRSLAILILVLATLKVDAEDTGPVLNNLLLVPAVLVLKINTLEVILSGHIQIIHSITDPISNSGASLHGVGLIHHLILDVLHQLADQLSHIEALPVLRLVDDRGAVLLVDVLALFDLLSVAGLLDVW